MKEIKKNYKNKHETIIIKKVVKKKHKNFRKILKKVCRKKLSNRENYIKREYGRNRYMNISEGDQEKLKEY